MFGNNSSGFLNEHEIVDYINHCGEVDLLNPSLADMLYEIYDFDISGKVISATVCRGQIKPDISVSIEGQEKFISIKKGTGNSVHQEKIEIFEDFLVNIGVSNEIIDLVKYFHFGDGTTDGSGNNRYSISEIKSQCPNLLSQVNNSLNIESILRPLFEKILFVGNLDTSVRVDAIYHGNSEEGLWATSSEIIDYLLNSQGNPNSLHFSKLTYQVWNRNLGFNPNTENRRYTMQVKWASMAKDFEIIRNS